MVLAPHPAPSASIPRQAFGTRYRYGTPHAPNLPHPIISRKPSLPTIRRAAFGPKSNALVGHTARDQRHGHDQLNQFRPYRRGASAGQLPLHHLPRQRQPVTSKRFVLASLNGPPTHLRSSHQPAAINWDDRAVHIAGCRREQENGSIADILGDAPAASRNAIDDRSAAIGVRSQGRSHRR